MIKTFLFLIVCLLFALNLAHPNDTNTITTPVEPNTHENNMITNPFQEGGLISNFFSTMHNLFNDPSLHRDIKNMFSLISDTTSSKPMVDPNLQKILFKIWGWDKPYQERMNTFLEDVRSCGNNMITEKDFNSINEQVGVTADDIKRWDNGNISIINDGMKIMHGMHLLSSLVDERLNELQHSCLEAKLSLQKLKRMKNIASELKTFIQEKTGLTDAEVNAIELELPQFFMSLRRAWDAVMMNDQSPCDFFRWINASTAKCGKELTFDEMKAMKKSLGITRHELKHATMGSMVKWANLHNLMRIWLHTNMDTNQRMCYYQSIGDMYLPRLHDAVKLVVDGWMHLVASAAEATENASGSYSYDFSTPGRLIHVDRNVW